MAIQDGSDGLKAVAEYLVSRGEMGMDKVGVVVSEDYKSRTVVVPRDGGGVTLKTFDVARPLARRHSFKDLAGFVSYLNSGHCVSTGNGIVFVSADKVAAELNYGACADREVVTLDLAYSEEYNALLKLMSGRAQKTLWRLLVTDLRDSMDPALLLAISSIKMMASAASAASIDISGVVNESGSNTIALSYASPSKGTVSTELDVDWEWTGRIFEAFDYDSRIALRLEVVASKEDGLTFVFHPVRLQKALRDARQALVEELEANVSPDRFTIHEGTF